MLPPNGAGSSKHSDSIRSNNDDLACTEVPVPIPILVRATITISMRRLSEEYQRVAVSDWRREAFGLPCLEHSLSHSLRPLASR
jgi:hypothetical protein